eukprot:TRINITY_DN57129_c0_g1_i1.p1 TRINITY_DN57129_c0_g1~~TRINITY_DN57129_c0_g1_i1.p1  ORF type:complete len:334 (-),score=60.49 TRINITY_DN57129_c0_g1_i1:160-1161(-)
MRLAKLRRDIGHFQCKYLSVDGDRGAGRAAKVPKSHRQTAFWKRCEDHCTSPQAPSDSDGGFVDSISPTSASQLSSSEEGLSRQKLVGSASRALLRSNSEPFVARLRLEASPQQAAPQQPAPEQPAPLQPQQQEQNFAPPQQQPQLQQPQLQLTQSLPAWRTSPTSWMTTGSPARDFFREAFGAYCGCHLDLGLDGFIKLCRDSGLLDDRYTAVDAQLDFFAALALDDPRSPASLDETSPEPEESPKPRLSLVGFERLLLTVADHRRCDHEAVRDAVALLAGPSSRRTSASRLDRVRCHDDTESALAVHGPLDNGVAIQRAARAEALALRVGG